MFRSASISGYIWRLPSYSPLLVKIPPDLADEALDSLARVAYSEGLATVIATSMNRLGLGEPRLQQTNCTLAEKAGGLSGAPLRRRGLEELRLLRASTGPLLPLVGEGGINSPAVAWKRITAGASLVQLYTGWIYRVPELVTRILGGLVSQLERHGVPHITAAVGCGLPWHNG